MVYTPVSRMNPSKEEKIKLANRINHIKDNMKRTGKSKKYYRGLSGLGCPNGRKRCCMCSMWQLGGKVRSRVHKKRKLINQ